jgi:hypothetical protein
MLPHQLFDRLFGRKEPSWVDRQTSVLDTVQEDARALTQRLGAEDRARLDQYLTSVREIERSIASLPPEYKTVVERPPEGGDLRDWPRIAKLQSDLLVHALASGQTRVASYMLTKCQGLSRFPWLGHTAQRHHEYTHGEVATPRGMRILRDICRWHVQEFAYLIGRLKATPEGDGTLLVAGHAGGLKTGLHTRATGTLGDLYLTLAEEVAGAKIESFPTAARKLSEVV